MANTELRNEIELGNGRGDIEVSVVWWPRPWEEGLDCKGPTTAIELAIVDGLCDGLERNDLLKYGVEGVASVALELDEAVKIHQALGKCIQWFKDNRYI